MLELFPVVNVYVQYPSATVGRLLFDIIKYNVIMAYLTRLFIKDYPNITSGMVKFVYYIPPA